MPVKIACSPTHLSLINRAMPLTCTMATLWAQKGRDRKPSQHHVLRKAKTKDQVPVLFTLEHSFSILGLPSYQVEQKCLVTSGDEATKVGSHKQGETERSGSTGLQVSCAFPKADCDLG